MNRWGSQLFSIQMRIVFILFSQTFFAVLGFSVYSSAQVNNQVNTSLATLKYKIVYFNRDMFIRPCAVTEQICSWNPTEIKIGTEILNSSAGFKGIDFQSGIQNPGLFVKDAKGLLQIVGTEAKVGEIVHVNLDRFMEASNRQIGIDQVISQVFSAFFFQMTGQWVQSQQSAAKAAQFWGQKFKSVMPLSFKEDSIEILFFKNREVRMMLLDNVQVTNISFEILRRSQCSNGFLPSLLLDFSNEGWTQYQSRPNGADGKFKSNLIYQCVDMTGKIEKWSNTVVLQLQFDGAFQKSFIPTSFKLDVSNAKKMN